MFIKLPQKNSYIIDEKTKESLSMPIIGDNLIRVLVPRCDTYIDSAGKAVYCFMELYFKDETIAKKAYSTELTSFMFLTKNKKLISLAITNEGTTQSGNIDNNIAKHFATIFTETKYIVIAHNHPNNNVNPSNTDVNSLKSTKQILWQYNLILLDGVILPKTSYAYNAYSMNYGIIETRKVEKLYKIEFKELFNVFKTNKKIDPDLLGALVLYGGVPIWEKYKKS